MRTPAPFTASALASLVLIGACDVVASRLPGGAARVEVVPREVVITPGSTLLLAARAYDRGDVAIEVAPAAWSSTDEEVAAVDTEGRIHALAEGIVQVEAAIGETKGVATVRVVRDPPEHLAECATPDPSWIWCDDFEVDRLAAYFEVDPAGGSTVREEGSGIDGSWSLRGRWEHGQVNAGGLKLAFGRTPDPYFRPVDGGTERYREIHWRFWILYPEGWEGGGGGKVTRATSFVSSRWEQAMFAHLWTNSDDPTRLSIDPATGTDELGNVLTMGYNDFDRMRWLGLARSATPVAGGESIGSWHCIELLARLNDPGDSNGIFELRIDGALDASREGLNWVGSYEEYGINAILLENYWDGGAPKRQARYFDRFVVSTDRIGC